MAIPKDLPAEIAKYVDQWTESQLEPLLGTATKRAYNLIGVDPGREGMTTVFMKQADLIPYKPPSLAMVAFMSRVRSEILEITATNDAPIVERCRKCKLCLKAPRDGVCPKFASARRPWGCEAELLASQPEAKAEAEPLAIAAPVDRDRAAVVFCACEDSITLGTGGGTICVDCGLPAKD